MMDCFSFSIRSIFQLITLVVTFVPIIAMKMEMVVQSPRAGTVKTLNIEPGMKIEGEDLILTFE